MTTQSQPTATDLSVEQLYNMVQTMTAQLAYLQQTQPTTAGAATAEFMHATKPMQQAARISTKPATSKAPAKVTVKLTSADQFDALEAGKPIVKLPSKKDLTYREAQNLCSTLGLKASGKYDDLLTRIGRHDAGTATAADYAKGKGLNNIKVLRAECAKYAIKAGGSAKVLADRIAAHHAGTLEQEFYKKANKGQGRVKKEKQAPRNAYGLDYRRAQRVAAYLKKQMPASVMPTDLVKNSGWDNVEHNLTVLLTTDWFTKLATKQIKEMAKECVFTDAQFQAFVAEVGL